MGNSDQPRGTISMLSIWFLSNILLWQFSIELFGSKLGLNVALLMVLGAVWILKRSKISSYSASVMFVFLIFLLVSYLTAMVGPCTDKFQKSLYTAPVLFFLTLVGLEIGWRATDSEWISLQKISVWVLLVAFFGLMIEILLPGIFASKAIYRDAGKFSGFYSEPSFVAYSLFPCVLILLEAKCKQLRRKGMFAMVVLVLLSRSSTLIMLILVWMVYRLVKQRDLARSLYLIAVSSLVVLLAAILNYDLLVAPTLERIVGVTVSDSQDNISSLALLQGWQDAWDNILRTNGLGLGFNMMGCTPLPDVPARKTLANVFKMQINEEDGTAVISKLISEMGVFGLLIFLALVRWWIRKEKKMASINSNINNQVGIIQLTMILSFVATTLIRSTGYFSGSFFLLVVTIAAIVKRQRDPQSL